MADNRNSITHLIRRAFSKPRLVIPYLQRRLRNSKIHRETTSHPEFYRRVMADDVVNKNPKGAVGTPREDRWLAIGELQFEFLTNHGLEHGHRLLEVGCGNLRAGWRFIDWLAPDRYTGIDISPEILLEANKTIDARGLQAKRPRIQLYDGFDMSFLPETSFDVVHAHSVISHVPPEVCEAILSGAHRVLKPGGFFDFTYNQSQTGEIWGFLDEDYYYPLEYLVELCNDSGFEAEVPPDWKYKQDKIRATKVR